MASHRLCISLQSSESSQQQRMRKPPTNFSNVNSHDTASCISNLGVLQIVFSAGSMVADLFITGSNRARLVSWDMGIRHRTLTRGSLLLRARGGAIDPPGPGRQIRGRL